MAYVDIHDGILFVEGNYDYSDLKNLGKVEYSKKFGFNQQSRNLDDVKSALAKKVKEMGANAIINFSYGQKTNRFWRAIIFATDDNVNWYAYGDAIVLSETDVLDLTKKTIN